MKQIMEQIHAQRLSDLYYLMNDFPKKYIFDIGKWTNQTNNVMTCDTACCAAGWGVVLLDSWKKHLQLLDRGITFIARKMPFGYSSEVLREFLGLSNEEEEFLFYSSAYLKGSDTDPGDVAQHIEQTLQDNNYNVDAEKILD